MCLLNTRVKVNLLGFAAVGPVAGRGTAKSILFITMHSNQLSRVFTHHLVVVRFAVVWWLRWWWTRPVGRVVDVVWNC